MTDENNGLPVLPAEWRRSAEAMAHALGLPPPVQASDAEWAVIMRNVGRRKGDGLP